MTVQPSDFTSEMTLLGLRWSKYSGFATELTAISTALGSDVTVHDCTVETPPVALRIGADKTYFTNNALLIVNKGKGGNLSNSTMASIINAVASGGGSAPTYPPYPAGAAALYSLRQTSAAYAGKCLKVQRLSDNAQQDIGFTSNGMVDYASALTFGAGSPLSVAVWYDQSGNGRNLTPSNTGPEFLLINGRPWLAFTNFSGNSQGATCLIASAPLNLTGDATTGLVLQLMTDSAQTIGALAGAMSCLGGGHGWGWLVNSGGIGKAQFTGDSVSVTGTTNLMQQSVNALAATHSAAGAVTMTINGANVGSGTGVTIGTATGPLAIGLFDTTAQDRYYVEGLISEAYVYSSLLTPTQVTALQTDQANAYPATTFNVAYNGVASVEFAYGEAIVMGNVLQYERTQAWTIFASLQLYSSMGFPTDNAILCNINHVAPYPGYGLLFTTQGTHYGVLHIIVSNTFGSNAIELFGTTNLADGKKHMVAASYDGSSTAAGVKAYVDGNVETLVIGQNNLSATIIATGQSLQAGAQATDPVNYLRGMLGFVQLDSIVRNQAYIQAGLTYGSLPNDATYTQLRLNLTENTGTIVNDTGATNHHFNGTLTSAGMWRP